jgi:hypothetical protein
MRTLTVVNPDDMVGIKRDAVNVLPKAKAAPGGGTPASEAKAAPVGSGSANPSPEAKPAETAKKRPRKG